MFHVSFDFSIGFDRGKQGEVTDSPADYIASKMQKGQRAEELALAKKATQAERLSALRTEINEHLGKQIEKFDADERIGKVFTLSIKDSETHVGRIDRDTTLVITFNSSKHTARFHSTGLVAFDHILEVRMNGQTPYLVHAEGRKERESFHSAGVPALCDKAIRVLA